MERIAGIRIEAHDRTNGIRARGPACLELVGDSGDADRGLGIKIDPEKNKYRGKQMDISIDWARVRVLVIPTNEELMIAKDTERLVSAAQ